MDLKANCTIHNNFEIEVRDAKTGKVKQKETAYNIVLDQIWTRLCSGLTYFTHIYFGTGSGTPTPSRSSLFTSLGNRVASNEEIKREVPISTWKRKIVLNPEEYVGQKITEVGIGFGPAASNLVTHAMLKDSEGNPISIIKTDTDVITIYATVFVTINSNYEHLSFVGLPNDSNSLINYLVGGSSSPTGSFGLNEIQAPYERLGSSNSATWTIDIAKRQRRTGITRFGTTTANGYAGYLDFSNIFTLKLQQPGVFTGHPYTDVHVGIGDGQRKEWVLPSCNIKQSTLRVKIDAMATSEVIIWENKAYPVRSKDSNPGSIPYPTDITISSDGKVRAVTSEYSPYIYTFDRIDGAWIRRANPDVLPTGIANAVALSKNNLVMAVAHVNYPFISTYDWKNETWVKRENPEIQLTGDAYDVGISYGGNVMVVVHNNSSYVTAYDWINKSWIARVAPINPPSSTSSKIAVSSDGNVMAITNSVAPYIISYDWRDGAWVKRLDPADSPKSKGTGVVLSHDGNIMITENSSSPYISTYDWTDGAWVRRPDSLNIPIARSISIASNLECSVLAMGHLSSPYFSVYDWRENTWVRRIEPKSLASISTNSIAISDDGALVGLTNTDSSHITTNEYIRNTMVKFYSPPAVGKNITADYTVEGIHKTDQYVIDVSFAIQFGEGVSIQ